MKRGFGDRLQDESGQGLGEYALIIALLSLGLVVLLVLFRDAIGVVFSMMAEGLSSR